MNNLNKQNFFTPEWKQSYPRASEHFNEWFEQYQYDNNWKRLFTDFGEEPQFTDIPFEMQFGIILKWVDSIPLICDTVFYTRNSQEVFIKNLNWIFMRAEVRLLNPDFDKI